MEIGSHRAGARSPVNRSAEAGNAAEAPASAAAASPKTGYKLQEGRAYTGAELGAKPLNIAAYPELAHVFERWQTFDKAEPVAQILRERQPLESMLSQWETLEKGLTYRKEYVAELEALKQRGPLSRDQRQALEDFKIQIEERTREFAEVAPELAAAKKRLAELDQQVEKLRGTEAFAAYERAYGPGGLLHSDS